MSKKVNQAQQTTYDALTPAQAAAVGNLLAGKSGRETAAEVGVTEETVSRWRNGSPAFVAALNVARHELYDSQLDVLRQLRRRALQALGDMLDDTDTGTQLKAVALVLRLDVAAPDGPQTPQQVAQDWDDKRRVDVIGAVLRGNIGEPGTLVLPHVSEPE